MKRYIKILAVLTCLFLCFCRQSEKNVPAIAKTGIATNNRHVKTLLELIGVLDISRDTIVVVRYNALFITTDFGKTWRDISNGFVSYDLTIDDHHILWINSSGGGIHEPRYSIFYKSKDYGKHWEIIRWDPFKFWPSKILSRPHQPLKIITRDDKVYQLVGNNPKTEWKYLDSVKDEKMSHKVSLSPYFIDDYWQGHMNLCKIVNNQTDTLVHLDSLNSVVNMVKVGNTLYIGGSSWDRNYKYDTYKAYLAAIINEKKIKLYQLPGSSATIVKGVGNRVWAFNGNNLYLKVKDKFIKFY